MRQRAFASIEPPRPLIVVYGVALGMLIAFVIFSRF